MTPGQYFETMHFSVRSMLYENSFFNKYFLSNLNEIEITYKFVVQLFPVFKQSICTQSISLLYWVRVQIRSAVVWSLTLIQSFLILAFPSSFSIHRSNAWSARLRSIFASTAFVKINLATFVNCDSGVRLRTVYSTCSGNESKSSYDCSWEKTSWGWISMCRNGYENDWFRPTSLLKRNTRNWLWIRREWIWKGEKTGFSSGNGSWIWRRIGKIERVERDHLECVFGFVEGVVWSCDLHVGSGEIESGVWLRRWKYEECILNVEVHLVSKNSDLWWWVWIFNFERDLLKFIR